MDNDGFNGTFLLLQVISHLATKLKIILKDNCNY